MNNKDSSIIEERNDYLEVGEETTRHLKYLIEEETSKQLKTMLLSSISINWLLGIYFLYDIFAPMG